MEKYSLYLLRVLYGDFKKMFFPIKVLENKVKI